MRITLKQTIYIALLATTSLFQIHAAAASSTSSASAEPAGAAPAAPVNVMTMLADMDAFYGDAGGHLNLTDTPLMDAAKKGDEAAVSALIAAGAIDHERTNGLNALHEANTVAVARLLVEAGLSVHAGARTGSTPLAWARGIHAPDLITYYHTCGADLNVTDIHTGLTPLIQAAMMGDDKIVSTLLSLGANPLHSNHRGETALQYARNSLRTAVPKLVEDAIRNLRPKFHDSADATLTALFSYGRRGDETALPLPSTDPISNIAAYLAPADIGVCSSVCEAKYTEIFVNFYTKQLAKSYISCIKSLRAAETAARSAATPAGAGATESAASDAS